MLILFNELLGLQEKLIKLGADFAELSPGLFLYHSLLVQHLLIELYFIFIFLVFSSQLSNFLRVKLTHFTHEQRRCPNFIQSLLKGPNFLSFILYLQKHIKG